MWTYLVILLSLSVIFFVFLRRVVLFYRKKKPEQKEEITTIENASESRSIKVSKERLLIIKPH